MQLQWYLAVVAFIVAVSNSAASEVSFNRDIRPLLAERCFECHGPSKSKGGLRLDQRSSATNALKSGAIAIAPNHPEFSELLRRIRPAAGDDRMPPPDSGKTPLSERQISLLETWISQGAKWDTHWAFKPIQRPAIPNAPFPDLAVNAIDAFIQKDLATHGLQPAPKPSQRILDRRLAFDLAGLPPFLSADSWDAKVDAYLSDPAYGERMALWWLDLVRYADSEGYFYDSRRNVYPYRDYVIRSFNANKRFGEFTIEQLAGDLLPNSNCDQQIASGYNRLILTTHENGANEAEYRTRYAADRVRNLGSVWLGLTLGCAQCHDHKFDPISSADFYRMAAFFADIKEEATAKEPEVFVGIDSPEYRALVEKSDEIHRIQAAGAPEIRCAELIAQKDLIETGKGPDYWPRSKRTDVVVALMRKKALGQATPAEQLDVQNYFERHFKLKLFRELTKTMKAREEFERNAQLSLVTEHGPIQAVRILPRGNWLDQSGPRVFPGFPKFLNVKCDSDVLDRDDLAEWLVSRDNPLTARVLANRLWQLFFGAGLVRSLDDFGAQGEAPSNPELLDYLASELLESGWNIKHIVRLIVTSYAYQQSSSPSALALEKDPENRLFSRQNRFPLQAELLRDNVRSISGLFSRRGDGPPVVSYLPDDFFHNVERYSEESDKIDSGERQYRRGIYLYRKRSFLHPSLAAFNASTREECMSQRAESESPREALALLNAPAFVECARAFAERIHDSAANDGNRITHAFQLALDRDPSEKEKTILLQLLNDQRKTFGANPISAAKMIRTGQYRWPKHIEAAELAAWTQIGRAILNLEETNTRY
jgi:hypothetical protein